MSDTFDPYQQWLGVDDPQRPPNYYRLLGLELFEDDVDTIADAADRQMARVRAYQMGKYAGLSQKVLNELTTAKLCLIDAEQRDAYNATIEDQMPETVVDFELSQPSAPLSASPAGGSSIDHELVPVEEKKAASKSAKTQRYLERRNQRPLTERLGERAPALAIAVPVLGILAIVCFFVHRSSLHPAEKAESGDKTIVVTLQVPELETEAMVTIELNYQFSVPDELKAFEAKGPFKCMTRGMQATFWVLPGDYKISAEADGYEFETEYVAVSQSNGVIELPIRATP